MLQSCVRWWTRFWHSNSKTFENRFKFRGNTRTRTIRDVFRNAIEQEAVNELPEVFSRQGAVKIQDRILPSIEQLSGSYYGMIEGVYPIHLVSQREIPLGEGKIAVFQQASADNYRFLENIPSAPSSKTMALDLQTHRLFVPSLLDGQFGVLVFAKAN